MTCPRPDLAAHGNCGCYACGVKQVEKYAPHVRAERTTAE